MSREIKDCCCTGWGCWVASLSVLVVMTGCTLLIQPTNPADIATYNNQIFQIVMSILGTAATLVGFIGLWIKSNRDRRELEKKTEQAAEVLADKTDATAAKVEEIAENTKRAPARATDTNQ